MDFRWCSLDGFSKAGVRATLRTDLHGAVYHTSIICRRNPQSAFISASDINVRPVGLALSVCYLDDVAPFS